MKTYYLIPIVLAAVFVPVSLNAQACESYYPVKAGTVMEMTHYDAKGKEKSVSKTIILKSTEIPGGIEITARNEFPPRNKDEKGFSSEYTIRCIEGLVTIDMKNYLSGESLGGFENMKMEVAGDQLDLPTNPTPGMQLKGGNLTLRILNEAGMQLMNMTMKISNRKVESKETVTTPAGSFECIKISYDSETKMLFTIKGHGVEYYSKNAGLVKLETYDAKGRLTGYTLLTKLE